MKLTNTGKMRLYQLYSIIAYVVPMILCYFIFFFNSEPKTQIGFWAYMILFMIFIFSYKVVVKSIQKTPLLFGSVMLLVFGLVMTELGESLTLISIFSIIGALISTILLKVENVYRANSKIAVNGNINVMQKNPAPAIPGKQAWKIAYGVLDE